MPNHRSPRATPHLTRYAAMALAALAVAPAAVAQTAAGDADIQRRVAAVTPKVVAWRRDIHQNPELGNREVRTGKLVADHLRSLGLEVQTGVAKTGVVAILRGALPGPVVALRADMDALPVTERVDLPFASRVTTQYNGQTVGVMHACGHDNHVAILMGAAEVLAGMRAQLPGTVKFIFQPAEEGPPAGEEGGAKLMLKEGVFDNPKPEAIFGLHVGVNPAPTGTISYRPLGTMAASDALRIVVRGRQTHGAVPWSGVDPIVASAQIIQGLQTIASRQSNLTTAPVVVTIGSINGGLRNNIIPDSVVMVGTIRTLDKDMRTDVHTRIRRTAELIAQSAGATAQVTIDAGTLITYNDPALTERMLPSLRRAAGAERVKLVPPTMGAEDFSEFQQRVPGLFVFLGVVPPGQDLATVAPNHSPLFFADEGALPVGVRAMTQLTVDYLTRR